MARRAGARAEDFVIEVGTGLGVLTRALAARAAQVRTVEIDSGLVRALEAESLLPDNVELRHADAREIDWRGWAEAAPSRKAVAPHPPPTLLLLHINQPWDGIGKEETLDYGLSQ